MLVVAEREQLILYETSVETEHGRLEIWVDGLATWKAGFKASESCTGLEQLDPRASSWSNGISNHVSDLKEREAFGILDSYLAEVFREINEIFSDSTDPMCEGWEQAAELLLHLFPGLVEYFIPAADLYDETSLDAMPVFAQDQDVSLCGGLRRYELTTSPIDGEHIVWAKKPSPDRLIFDSSYLPDSVELVELVDYAIGTETRQLLELHLATIGQAADHIRFVVNKLRAGVRITGPEQLRLRCFAITIINFQRQFRAVS